MFVLVWLLCSSADKLQKVWHTNFMLLYNKLIPFLTVNNKLHLFASQEQLQVFSKEFCNLVPQAHSRTVRCYHYLGHPPQLTVRWQRLLLKDIQNGSTQPAMSRIQVITGTLVHGTDRRSHLIALIMVAFFTKSPRPTLMRTDLCAV